MSPRAPDDLRYGIKTSAFYNSEQKESYISYISEKGASVDEIIRTEKMFGVLRKTEEAVGRDASTFSIEEAGRSFGKFEDISKTKYSTVNRIRRYVRWCRKCGFDNVSDGFLKFTPDREEYKKTKVGNPEGLAKILHNISVSSQRESIFGPHFRLCVWLLYAGVTTDLMDRFSGSCVSIYDLLVSFDNYRQFVLDRESLNDLTYVVENESPDRRALLPDYASHMQLPSHWYLMLARDASSITPFDFFPLNVQICGLFYRMWKNETFLRDSVDFFATAETAKNFGMSFRSEKNTQVDFKEQYERWKCAFCLP